MCSRELFERLFECTPDHSTGVCHLQVMVNGELAYETYVPGDMVTLRELGHPINEDHPSQGVVPTELRVNLGDCPH